MCELILETAMSSRKCGGRLTDHWRGLPVLVKETHRSPNHFGFSWYTGCAVAALSLLVVGGARVSAASFPPKTYLLHGTVTCTAVEAADLWRPGNEVEVLIAIAESRALVGWNSHGNTGEQYVLLGPTSDEQALDLSFPVSPGKGMLESELPCEGVGTQKTEPFSDRSGRFAQAQMAPFADFRFALFFSSDRAGVRIDDIASLLRQPGESGSMENPCGKLRLENKHGLASITFTQQGNDCLTLRRPDRRLHNVIMGGFPAGLERITYHCDFVPPLTERSVAPWASHCSIEQVGTRGKRLREEFRVDVDQFSTDDARINQVIDRVLKRIPENTAIQGHGPIEYVWKGGQTVRNIDPAALQTAETLQFGRGGSSRLWRILLTVNIVAVLGVFVVVVWRRRNHQS